MSLLPKPENGSLPFGTKLRRVIQHFAKQASVDLPFQPVLDAIEEYHRRNRWEEARQVFFPSTSPIGPINCEPIKNLVGYEEDWQGEHADAVNNSFITPIDNELPPF